MIDSHGSSISSWFLRKKACIVAIVPVSVPLSSLIIEDIILASYKYSKYQRPITLGSLLVTQIRSHNSFLLAVSMQPYTANGKVLFWYPISLSWPSSEWTQLGPFVVKLPLGFVFYLPTGPRASRPFGSRSYIAA